MTTWVLIIKFYYSALAIDMASKESCHLAATTIAEKYKNDPNEPTIFCIHR